MVSVLEILSDSGRDIECASNKEIVRYVSSPRDRDAIP